MKRITWVNRTQPQTLTGAVLLGYFSAGLLLLSTRIDSQLGVDLFELAARLFTSGDRADGIGGIFVPGLVLLLLGGGFVMGGIGTSHERRWGNWLLTAAASYSVLSTLWWGVRFGFELGLFLRVLFDVFMLVLLFHPMSRNHRRVWFR